MRKLVWTGLLLALLALGAWWQAQPDRPPDAARDAAPDAASGAAPVASADAGTETGDRRDLQLDEARGGHTIARHVGLSDADLRARLTRESISAASTYPDLPTAERVVGQALATHATRVNGWRAQQGSRPNLVISHAVTPREPIGRVLRRGRAEPVDAYAAVVVLRWRGDDFLVLTSYPEERARGR
jgi:hypothetical protein